MRHRKTAPPPRAGAQSAMEYLMTYGWAILIISVVLGSLYSLGVFNTANLQPKVGPGGCHVYRPNGPGTSWNINLVGSCQSALPQYVAQFNGQSAFVYSTSVLVPNGLSSITEAAWVNPQVIQGDSTLAGIVRVDGHINNGGVLLALQGSTGRPSMAGWNDDFVPSSGPTLNYNVWNFVAVTVSGNAVTLYVNGKSESGALSNPISLQSGGYSSNLGIGSLGTPDRSFNGCIADVQVYNTSLTTNQVQYLYNEGIGGVPIDLQNLVGWWPLNGDFKDYSGNNNNGAPSAVNFNGIWTAGYYH